VDGQREALVAHCVSEDIANERKHRAVLESDDDDDMLRVLSRPSILKAVSGCSGRAWLGPRPGGAEFLPPPCCSSSPLTFIPRLSPPKLCIQLAYFNFFVISAMSALFIL
jgi:hypothetical protein